MSQSKDGYNIIDKRREGQSQTSTQARYQFPDVREDRYTSDRDSSEILSQLFSRQSIQRKHSDQTGPQRTHERCQTSPRRIIVGRVIEQESESPQSQDEEREPRRLAYTHGYPTDEVKVRRSRTSRTQPRLDYRSLPQPCPDRDIVPKRERHRILEIPCYEPSEHTIEEASERRHRSSSQRRSERRAGEPVQAIAERHRATFTPQPYVENKATLLKEGHYYQPRQSSDGYNFKMSPRQEHKRSVSSRVSDRVRRIQRRREDRRYHQEDGNHRPTDENRRKNQTYIFSETGLPQPQSQSCSSYTSNLNPRYEGETTLYTSV